MRRQKDVEARWTKKYGNSFSGYKLSACDDKRYKLFRTIKIGTASEHDTLHFEAVIDTSNTSRDIYADKGPTLHMNWKAAAYNLHRFAYLKEVGIVAF